MIDMRVDGSRGALIAALSPGTRVGLLGVLFERLATTAPDKGTALVIDVSDVVLSDVAAVKEFVRAVRERGKDHSIRIVARRRTARALLRCWGGAALSLHPSVEDALADRSGATSISV